ncbi:MULTISPECIES: mannonate dehydratase [Geobacillus]|jgi:mannonate dehydratase|uniref:mannonate dehydratase n=1 Tax=Geobacillus TaxID=129337 RepID=UPI0009C05F01|nr:MULTISPECIES: mannonate dehydratase [Geobacillus]ARP42890.1 Mannonate dehydratase [Geobacillus thermodenitrificans]MEC5186828.1 mannonate dehydratase [Geobacillus thermodenitrificans]MED3905896.1 mannonate dehydratase [Geobacillus thermodenitrificans]NNU88440.1 mannonate dehydratase [Geobacillus sp. MR]OQP08694.1 mannonate dehydratase [Geobacillus sp. 47C-IIb]
MKMTFRWFGKDYDTVSLAHIRQIPGVEGIVGALYHIPVGEVWPLEDILELKRQVNKNGFHLEVIESVNVHEDIKLGLPSRERYIENYKQTIRNLSKAGVKVICYNFMPIFDWTRSDLAKRRPDGSTVLAYEKQKVEQIDPEEMIRRIENGANGFLLPGWEPERLKTIKPLFALYKGVTEDDLLDHLRYFLEQIVPVAEECGIQMAIHPDDPPWSVFGLPRIVTNKENLKKIINMVNSPANGLTLCSGSLGANPDNDIPDIFRYFLRMGRVPFVHVRNIEIHTNGDFEETSHRSCDGSLNICEIVKVLHESDFQGYIRPDHGRMIWGEQARPGYGLYDRALGIMYLLGIWDSLENEKRKREGDKTCSQSIQV